MNFHELEILGGIILGVIIVALIMMLNATPDKIAYCGDGICSDDEKGVCDLDCDWCGDGYCQDNEDCLSCQNDCGDCKASSYCGDKVCNVGECESGCTKDCSLAQCINGKCELESGENCVTAPLDCKCKFDEMCNKNTKRCEIVTCGNGKCDSGENSQTCPNDCKESYVAKDTSNEKYPIIFIHGHSPESKDTTAYSINSWTEMQMALNQDGLATNKGVIIPSSNPDESREGSWGESDKPISVRTTYYKGQIEGDNFVIRSEDEKSIVEYGERLRTVVNIVKHNTGKKKVIIIAHSMGGLVARSYIKNSDGEENVYALITVGTPNHGVDGKESQYNGVETNNIIDWGKSIFVSGVVAVARLPSGCNVAHGGAECGDMWWQSPFIISLNSGDETYGSVKYYSIIGDCCKGTDGTHDDEAVSVDSATLNGAEGNFIIPGNEVLGTGTYHGDLTSPSKNKGVYSKIKEILNKIN